MARELESYRDNVEDLLRFFDDRRLLSVTDVARYLCISRDRARRQFGVTADGITIPTLARKLAKLSA